MKIRNEISVGVIALATILAGIWGINYLKGRNILKKSYTINVSFPAAKGMEASAPVMLRGVKIGYVESIDLLLDAMKVDLALAIQSDYPLREGSTAYMESDLLGSSGIRVEPGRGPGFLADGDTIPGIVIPGMLEELTSQVQPFVQQATLLAGTLDTLVRSLDSLAGSMDLLLTSGQVSDLLDNLADAGSSLSRLLREGESLDASFRNLESLSSSLDSVSRDLQAAGLDSIGLGLQAVLAEAEILMRQVNTGDGSAGALLYSDSLHNALLGLVNGLDNLVTDLKENPQDYVQISVFGKDKKQ